MIVVIGLMVCTYGITRLLQAMFIQNFPRQEHDYPTFVLTLAGCAILAILGMILLVQGLKSGQVDPRLLP
jgi:hypothetical protein